MWVLFAALSAALLLTCIWQRIQYRKLQKEINYISNRLETLSITSENGFVLLPTDHACMKKLGATINTLLQNFYEKKSEYEQAQKAMAQFLTNISHDIRAPLTVETVKCWLLKWMMYLCRRSFILWLPKLTVKQMI